MKRELAIKKAKRASIESCLIYCLIKIAANNYWIYPVFESFRGEADQFKFDISEMKFRSGKRYFPKTFYSVIVNNLISISSCLNYHGIVPSELFKMPYMQFYSIMPVKIQRIINLTNYQTIQKLISDELKLNKKYLDFV